MHRDLRLCVAFRAYDNVYLGAMHHLCKVYKSSSFATRKIKDNGYFKQQHVDKTIWSPAN